MMGKMIDLESALEAVWKSIWMNDYEKGQVQTILRKVPAVDAAPPVVRGRWGKVADDDEFWGELEYPQCSVCNELAHFEYKYCPHCGAKMDGGADNAD